MVREVSFGPVIRICHPERSEGSSHPTRNVAAVRHARARSLAPLGMTDPFGVTDPLVVTAPLGVTDPLPLTDPIAMTAPPSLRLLPSRKIVEPRVLPDEPQLHVARGPVA